MRDADDQGRLVLAAAGPGPRPGPPSDAVPRCSRWPAPAAASARPRSRGRGSCTRADDLVEERPRFGPAQHVVPDGRVEAGQGSQLRHPVRVGQEARVEHHVGLVRQPVLVAEGLEAHEQLVAQLVGQQRLLQAPAQLPGRQTGGVDHHVGLGAQRRQQPPLPLDALEQASLRQRVGPPGRLVAGDQRLVGGLQVEQPERDARLAAGGREPGPAARSTSRRARRTPGPPGRPGCPPGRTAPPRWAASAAAGCRCRSSPCPRRWPRPPTCPPRTVPVMTVMCSLCEAVAMVSSLRRPQRRLSRPRWRRRSCSSSRSFQAGSLP